MSWLASTWRLVRAPGAAARHDAVRVAVAGTTGFALGRYVIDDPQTAVYGALAPIALLGLGHVAGSPAVRARAYVGAGLAAAAATAAGTVASGDTVAAAAVLFAGALVLSQAGIAGHTAAGLSRAVLLPLVVSCGIPAPDSATPDRLAGLAIGVTLTIIAVLLLWPDGAGQDYRRRLAAALEPLADRARGVADGRSGASSSGAAALAAARPFALGVVERPIGVGTAAVAERRLAAALEALDDLLARAEPDVLDASDRSLVRAAADALAAAAALLRSPQARPPDLDAFETSRRHHRVAVDARLAERLGRGGADDELLRAFDDAVRLRRLAAVTAFVGAEARVAAGDDPAPDDRSLASRLAGQVDIRLTLDSVLMRNGLRLALGLGAAQLAAGAFDLSHGFWVVFATLTVMRASARHTGANAVRALAGTAAGAVLATALVVTFEAEADVYLILLPLLFFAAIYGSAVSFVAGQIGFTVLIVVLFGLTGPPHWTTGLIRLEDVAVGAAIGLLIGVAAWPRGPAGQLRRSIAGALDAGALYTRAVARRLLDTGNAADLELLRRDAMWSARRAEDVLTTHLDETVDRGAALEHWAGLLGRTQGLWYEASLVSGGRSRAAGACPELAGTVAGAIDRLTAGFQEAGAALRDGRRPAPDSAAPDTRAQARSCAAAVAGDADRQPVVDLLAVRAWTGELRRRLDSVRDAVGALA